MTARLGADNFQGEMMDPQACLNELCAAVLESDDSIAVEAFENLCDWIIKGGFRPNIREAIKHAWENH